MGLMDSFATRARSAHMAGQRPECPYCGATEGLRVPCDGGGHIPPEYTCETCFTPRDDGPCFDDLPPLPDGIVMDSFATRARSAYRAARRADVEACIDGPWRMLRPLGLLVGTALVSDHERLIHALKWKLDAARDHLRRGSHYADISLVMALEAALIAARYLRRKARNERG